MVNCHEEQHPSNTHATPVPVGQGVTQAMTCPQGGGTPSSNTQKFWLQVEVLLQEFWDPSSGPVFAEEGDQQRLLEADAALHREPGRRRGLHQNQSCEPGIVTPCRMVTCHCPPWKRSLICLLWTAVAQCVLRALVRCRECLHCCCHQVPAVCLQWTAQTACTLSGACHVEGPMDRHELVDMSSGVCRCTRTWGWQPC